MVKILERQLRLLPRHSSLALEDYIAGAGGSLSGGAGFHLSRKAWAYQRCSWQDGVAHGTALLKYLLACLLRNR